MRFVTDDGLVHDVSAMPDGDQLGITWCAGRFDATFTRARRPVTCLDCIAGVLRYQEIQLEGRPIVEWGAKALLRARRARETRIPAMVGALYPMLLKREIQDINTELIRRRSKLYHR